MADVINKYTGQLSKKKPIKNSVKINGNIVEGHGGKNNISVNISHNDLKGNIQIETFDKDMNITGSLTKLALDHYSYNSLIIGCIKIMKIRTIKIFCMP